jgi:hypothetical protein
LYHHDQEEEQDAGGRKLAGPRRQQRNAMLCPRWSRMDHDHIWDWGGAITLNGPLEVRTRKSIFHKYWAAVAIALNYIAINTNAKSKKTTVRGWRAGGVAQHDGCSIIIVHSDIEHGIS